MTASDTISSQPESVKSLSILILLSRFYRRRSQTLIPRSKLSMPRANGFAVRSACYKLVLIILLFVRLELSKISRGYEITLRKYQDLLAKSLESELSENMEKKQKGEQFQILDPANFPAQTRSALTAS